MTDNMLERAARAYAAYKCMTADPTGANLPDDIWRQGIEPVRAVLTALREPTGHMTEEMHRENITHPRGGTDGERWNAIFTAGIDAILSEGAGA